MSRWKNLKGVVGRSMNGLIYSNNWTIIISLITSTLLVQCTELNPPPPFEGVAAGPPPVTAAYSEWQYQDTSLQVGRLEDKILGLLVGSAIGDALGAPTEMWGRWQISEEYGFVDSLDLVLREPSPEGPWGRNLPAGAGTDDTRWKALLTNFFVEQSKVPSSGPPLPGTSAFAEYVTAAYVQELEALKAIESLEPEPYTEQIQRFVWLQEWARITRAYSSGDIDAYRNSLSRFYGGEMACAGMLYAPMIGAFYPGRPEIAYTQMYELALFDLGYARDISGLTAALTALAFRDSLTTDSLKYQLITVDPAEYFDSRLLSRVAFQQFQQAERIVRNARKIDSTVLAEQNIAIPPDYPYDSLHYLQTQDIYRQLNLLEQDVPFHAGEIHLINLTALLFSELDFQRALEFIVNYGRDNDTVAAVTGAILGAYHGAAALPAEMKELVIRVNREELGIDLVDLAAELTQAILNRRKTMLN
ncbi:MAG: ADP-ribosylglycohydrolase family protein [Bacteroidota bacterium]